MQYYGYIMDERPWFCIYDYAENGFISCVSGVAVCGFCNQNFARLLLGVSSMFCYGACFEE